MNKRTQKGYTLSDVKELVELHGLKLLIETVKYNCKGLVDYNESFTIIFPEGYKSDSNIQKIRGHIPEIYSKTNPHTINNIKIWLDLNDPDYHLVSEVFKGAREELEWGHIKLQNFNMSWNQFSRGQRHPLLKIEKIKQKLKLDQDKAYSIVQDILSNSEDGWELIKGQEYVNVGTPLLLINKEGYLSKMSLSHLREGKKPTLYGCDPSLSIYNLNKFVIENTNCTIKEDQKYIGTNSKYIFICKKHGEFKKSMNEVLTSNGEYCCPKCSLEKRSGMNHYRHNPDKITDRRGLQYNSWRKDVLKNDRYTCQACKKRGGKLHSHHKDGWNWCEERRFDVSNGAALCENCHSEFHMLYGLGNNTENQYLEFIERKLNDAISTYKQE